MSWKTKITVKTDFRSTAILLQCQVMAALSELGVKPGDVTTTILQIEDDDIDAQIPYAVVDEVDA